MGLQVILVQERKSAVLTDITSKPLLFSNVVQIRIGKVVTLSNIPKYLFRICADIRPIDNDFVDAEAFFPVAMISGGNTTLRTFADRLLECVMFSLVRGEALTHH